MSAAVRGILRKTRRPVEAIGAQAIVAVLPEESFDVLAGRFRKRVTGDSALRYELVRASGLADPEAEADFILEPHAPSGPGRVLLFETASLAVYEQGKDGAVYRNGRRQIAELPLAVGRPDADVDGEVVEAESVAFLYLRGRQTRLLTTTRVLFLYRQPRFQGFVEFPGWLEDARALIASGEELR